MAYIGGDHNFSQSLRKVSNFKSFHLLWGTEADLCLSVQEPHPSGPTAEARRPRERGRRLRPSVRRVGRGVRAEGQALLRQPHLLPQRAGRDRQPGRGRLGKSDTFL